MFANLRRCKHDASDRVSTFFLPTLSLEHARGLCVLASVYAGICDFCLDLLEVTR